MKTLYPAVFAPMNDGSGSLCRVPDIPHCVTSGKDTVVDELRGADEARKVIQKCREAYIEKFCR